jgi:hypothetical protein
MKEFIIVVIILISLIYGADKIVEKNSKIVEEKTHVNYYEPEPEPTYYFKGYDIKEDPNYDNSKDLLYNKRMLEGFEKWKKEQHGN